MTDETMALDGEKSPQRIDVAEIMSAFQGVGTQIRKSMADFSASQDSANLASQAQQEATMDRAGAENEIMRIDMMNKAQVERNNARAAAAFGVNPNASNYIIESMGADILSKQKRLEAKDAEIQAKMELGFFQDPLQWVSNQFTLGTDVAAYNNLLNGMSQQQSVLHDLMQRSTEAATVNAAIQQTVSEDKINALATANLAKATGDVAKSQYELAKLNMDSANVRINMSKGQFDSLIAVNNVLAQREQLDRAERQENRQIEQDRLNEEYRQATLSIQKERLLLAKSKDELDTMNKEELLRQRQEANEGRQVLQRKLNQVTTTYGMNPIPVAEYFQLSPATRQFLEQAMMDPDIERGRMAGTTAGALQTVSTLSVPLTPGMRIVGNKLAAIQSTLARNDINFMSYDQKEKLLKTDEEIKKQLENEKRNIPDQGGVYSAPPLAAVLSIPGVQKWSPTLAAELAPLAQQDQNWPTKGQQVFDIALKNIAEGKLSPGAAALEIANMYSNVMLDNNAQRAYRRWNIPVMSETTTGYKTNIVVGYTTGGGFASPQRVLNMANPAELEAALTRAAMAKFVDPSKFSLVR